MAIQRPPLLVPGNLGMSAEWPGAWDQPLGDCDITPGLGSVNRVIYDSEQDIGMEQTEGPLA